MHTPSYMKPPPHPRLSRRALLARGALALGSAALPALGARAQSVGPVMATLSAYMAAAKDRALPPDVVEKAKHHILDTLAAMVSGSELPPGRAALALARAQAGAPASTVVGLERAHRADGRRARQRRPRAFRRDRRLARRRRSRIRAPRSCRRRWRSAKRSASAARTSCAP